ncbi:transferrin-binding protein-like solute binding protein [Novosphingobium sp. ST904]|uniref:transferrin-binding protein-like solute binding protein n=1 Tax=Novosphingobium sp. ST904 TaxID=1684385 RepID=UPI0010EC0B48|nr:transferrin-binding protein-like solute binding protein [Novosphingobium sp. ST904]TCM34487.1 hypothetical protein EDF59_11747 [Novosphingobium sp. ST904]
MKTVPVAKLATMTSLTALSLLLAACGGGGDVNSTPTPTPAPTPTPTPTPTAKNDDLIGPLVSENFTNDAILGKISVSTKTGSATHSAGKTALTIAYNAANQSYTLTDGSVSQAFRQADIDPAQSNAAVTTYKLTAKSTTDFLTLSKTGSGAGQTRYVGAGFWQRVTEGKSSVDGRFDAFAYGVKTAAADMPRTGAASYDVKLLGVSASNINIHTLAGSGRLDADFATGAIHANVPFSMTESETGLTGYGSILIANAMMKSGTNGFAGILGTTTNYETGTSTFQGSFYGPGAAEVGATFSSAYADEATVGVVLGGRNDYPLNQHGSILNPENATFFRVRGQSVSLSLDGNGKLVSTGQASGLFAKYAAWGSGGLFYRSSGQILAPLQRRDVEATYDETTAFLGMGQEAAVVAGLQYDRTGPSTILDAYVYGDETASSAVPRTGTGHYNARIGGAVLETGQQLQTLDGTGRLAANLGTGTLSGSGDYQLSLFSPASMIVPAGSVYSGTDNGTWTTSATISSTTNAIAGTFSLDGTKDYTGNLDARFYGAAGDQIGGTFLLSSTTGGKANGYLIGSTDPAISPPTGLANITGTTLLHGIGAEVAYRVNINNDYSDNFAGATTTDYAVELSSGSPVGAIRVTRNSGSGTYAAMQSSDVDSATSNAERTVYRSGAVSSGGFSSYTAVDRYIFDGKGGRIALTYSGFAKYVLAGGVTQSGAGNYNMGYIAYGQATPKGLMPTTGTASYTGVAHGSAVIYNNDIRIDMYDVSGTSSLSANFGTGKISGQLALSGTNLANGRDLSFGTTSFAGTIGDVTADAQRVGGFSATRGGGLEGTLNGMFFGPNANEVGGNFNFEYFSPSVGGGTVRGAFVAAGR